MDKWFPVDKMYNNTDDFFTDLDKYQNSTCYKLKIHESRSIEKYCERHQIQNTFDNIRYYEIYLHCYYGKIKSVLKTQARNQLNCPVKLVARLDKENKQFAIKEWIPDHNHDPIEDDSLYINWVEKEKKKEKIKEEETIENKAARKIIKKLNADVLSNPANAKKKITMLESVLKKWKRMDDEDEEEESNSDYGMSGSRKEKENKDNKRVKKDIVLRKKKKSEVKKQRLEIVGSSSSEERTIVMNSRAEIDVLRCITTESVVKKTETDDYKIKRTDLTLDRLLTGDVSVDTDDLQSIQDYLEHSTLEYLFEIIC